MKLLDDRTAIVTGAGSPGGIGRATARLFAEHGARVALLDLAETDPQGAAGKVGPEHRGYVCDVRDEVACRAIDETKAVPMPLQPGEMSVHDVGLAHASGPNRSEDRRIGVSLHFMPTRTRQSLGDWDSAALVRGSDDYGNFHHTPVFASDFDGAAVAFHDRATRAVREILYRDARQATGKL